MSKPKEQWDNTTKLIVHLTVGSMSLTLFITLILKDRDMLDTELATKLMVGTFSIYITSMIALLLHKIIK